MKRTAIVAIFLSIPLLLALHGGAWGGDENDPTRVSAANLKQYLAIHQALAAGSTRGVTDAAGIIAIETNTLLKKSGARLGKPQQEVLRQIMNAAAALFKEKELSGMREVFKVLSRYMIRWSAQAHPRGIVVMLCEERKEFWLQKEGPPRNPYRGGGDPYSPFTTRVPPCGKRVEPAVIEELFQK
ncbi:MAG: DUF3347 domain-containing protein [Deltaproteobacteria bacterium]|nr:MAG: DUF3347 domain-containing protein [Deltaproteobacteria bacterium]